MFTIYSPLAAINVHKNMWDFQNPPFLFLNNTQDVWNTPLVCIPEETGYLMFPCKAFKRSIFQTFWRLHCCTNCLFFDLEISNFGDLLIFFILSDCAKHQKDWTKFIIDILQGSPIWIFGRLQKQKTSKGGPL